MIRRQHYLNSILESWPIIPCTEQTAYEHARIWAELEASGKRIGFFDLIVGATALERGNQVATFNNRHFAQVKRLSVIEPK
jgi:predicted nucleic acid-binding protein